MTELLELRGEAGPEHAAEDLDNYDKPATGAAEHDRVESTSRPLGLHEQLLAEHLLGAANESTRAKQVAEASAKTARAAADAGATTNAPVQQPDISTPLTAAQTELAAAMQHATFITFLADVTDAHVGEAKAIGDYCQDWGLTSGQVAQVWGWLVTDPHVFDGTELPVAIDAANQVAYRKPLGWLVSAFYASAVVWGGGLVYGVVTLLFAILNWAGITTWPHEQWGWKLFVLFLFVSLGAAAHLGAKFLNVNYSNPIKVYDAGGVRDWLALRWIGILQAYVPVGVVVASLWGAGNVPKSFQTLGTALLAGYSADSFVGAAVSKLQGGAGSKASAPGAAPRPPAAAGAGSGGT